MIPFIWYSKPGKGIFAAVVNQNNIVLEEGSHWSGPRKGWCQPCVPGCFCGVFRSWARITLFTVTSAFSVAMLYLNV